MIGFMTMILGVAAVAAIIGKIRYEVRQREFQRRIDSLMDQYSAE